MASRHPSAPPQALAPGTADLENPLYYLENMETLVGWVRDHHADLLTAAERDRLAGFFALSQPARALLTRLVMRTGEHFRADRLNYPELGVAEAVALTELIDGDWLDPAPTLELDQLFRLYTLPELRPVFADDLAELGQPRSLAKARMRELLQAHYPEPRTVTDWLGPAAAPVVRINQMALFDRVRLMFFGNLRQSWSDFVLVELGHQRYETVPFTPDARAFARREEVDHYLVMHQCRQWLDEGVPAAEVWPEVPAPVANPWLTSRRDRLLLEMGRQAEREGERELALQALAASGHREARLKRLRLLERLQRFEQAWDLACRWQMTPLSDAEIQGLGRILKRLARRLDRPSPLPDVRSRPEAWTLELPRPGHGSVELAVAQHLGQDQSPVYYVENTLINGLFGLLCWSTIFAPLPGAFFHPFHTGPADLTRDDFLARRRDAFDRCFGHLADGSYRQRMRDTFARKQGLANPFVIWPVLTEALLDLALDSIPAADLRLLFERLLLNIREHRSGWPDLIQFLPVDDRDSAGRRYRMIEVKGPGDRLQDHQRRWLAFFEARGIPASVCYVRWQSQDAPS